MIKTSKNNAVNYKEDNVLYGMGTHTYKIEMEKKNEEYVIYKVTYDIILLTG